MSDAVILRADERFQTTYLQADCARKWFVSMSNGVSSKASCSSKAGLQLKRTLYVIPVLRN
jgi:hypothetical protein